MLAIPGGILGLVVGGVCLQALVRLNPEAFPGSGAFSAVSLDWRVLSFTAAVSLGATLLCGMFFVGMQVYEFTHFVHKGLTLQRNLFGASFFVLTGFHGTHVTIGVIWLLTMFVLALRRRLPPERSLNLEIAALYWHFVDVVWIVIFPVVYLIR